MAGEGKRDFPACIGYQSPWYKEYSMIEDYFSRVNVVLTRGKPLTRLAVIHPIESYWLCFGPVDSGKGEPEFREQCFRDLTHWLSHGLVDFDFVSESLFPDQTQLDGIGKTLRVGACSYDAVLVPNLRTIRSTTLIRLQKFAAAGGKVFVAGKSPSLVDAVRLSSPPTIPRSISLPWTRYEILRALDPFKDIQILTDAGSESDTLLYQMREDSLERFVFICNTERKRPVSTTVFLKGAWDVIVLDAFTGSEWGLETTQKECWTTFPYRFEGTASLLIRLLPCHSIAKACRPQEPLSETFEKRVTGLALDEVTLSEPNVLLLDYATYKLGTATDWSSLTEILRIENIIRTQLSLPLKLDNFSQPWTIASPSRNPVANLHLRFTISSAISLSACRLAIEDSSSVTILLNDVPVPSTPDGWWVDEDIHTIPLPSLPSGESILELIYPFGLMTNIERVYLLGDFGVTIRGRKAIVTGLDKSSLDFGDWTRQGLPFYAGNVTYHCHFTVPSSASATPDRTKVPLVLSVPQFVSPVLSVSLDSHPVGHVFTEPRMLLLPPLVPGSAHQLSITAFGNRENAFGTLHLPDGVTTWYGPNEFRTDRPGWWMDEWNVKRMGVLTCPAIRGRGKEKVDVQPHILRFPYERAQQRS